MLNIRPSRFHPLHRPGIFIFAVAIAFSIPIVARADSLLDAGAIDYSIMNADGKVFLGRGRFTIQRLPDGIVLQGESRYSSGEYDTESDSLSPGTLDTLPALQKFEHLFYSADGTLVRAGHADLTASFASCVDTPVHFEKSQKLDFPTGTWAGASVLIPIQRFLTAGAAGTLKTSVFTCAPGPAVYNVTVTAASSSVTRLFPANVVQVTVKPHFGWYDVLIAPFVPKLNAWFDPSSGWSFEGVEIARYYKGPQIVIVRGTGAELRPAPPDTTSSH